MRPDLVSNLIYLFGVNFLFLFLYFCYVFTWFQPGRWHFPRWWSWRPRPWERPRTLSGNEIATLKWSGGGLTPPYRHKGLASCHRVRWSLRRFPVRLRVKGHVQTLEHKQHSRMNESSIFIIDHGGTICSCCTGTASVERRLHLHWIRGLFFFFFFFFFFFELHNQQSKAAERGRTRLHGPHFPAFFIDE